MTAERLGGFFVGAIVALLFVAIPITRRAQEARKGWELRPVVVAATDMQLGTEVTFDVLSQRSVPEMFASPSYVMPDEASYVIGKKVTVLRIEEGDPIEWSQFVGREAEREVSHCAMDIAPKIKGAMQSDGGTDSAEAARELAEAWFHR